VSKYFGDSEKAIRQLFGKASAFICQALTSHGLAPQLMRIDHPGETARARKAAPCLLFFDEFDAIAHKRSFDKGDDGNEDSGGGVYARILSTFLNELDGVGSAGKTAMDGILVVAATNRRDALDAALVRPGRIDKTLELGYPTHADVQVRQAVCRRASPHADSLMLFSHSRKSWSITPAECHLRPTSTSRA
jgi:SpoVK/Ycf46/Vps4 family AAA+-type ATPase